MTKRVYLNTLTPEEIIKRLKNGEVVKVEDLNSFYKMVDGVFVRYNGDKICIASCGIYINEPCYYFEEEEPFEITETGVYKTRDGRKAFVYDMKDNESDDFPVYYVIDGDSDIYCCMINGKPYRINYDAPTDIISKWED